MEPATAPIRLAAMRRALLACLPLLLVACAGAPASRPTSSMATPAAATIPTTAVAPATLPPTPSPAASLLPLPVGVAGIPGAGDASVVLDAETQRGAIQPGVGRPFQLGHCGLGSPIDFDGSLWNPVAGHDGEGGPLTEDQRGELINPTEVTLIVLTPDVAELHTPLGAVITVVRLAGSRAYYLCM